MPGFPFCADIDECHEGYENDCAENEICANNVGSYECHCKIGWVEEGDECKDYDECNDADICGGVSVCVNTDGSYACECPDGFNFKVG